MVKVDFYSRDYLPSGKLIYSVIAARFQEKWVFVRHHLRKTFEIPGGHIEQDESADEAAKRELREETGALLFNLEFICPYSVTQDGGTRFGKLYYAEIYNIGPVPDISEIEEITFLESLPDPVTYPEIQPHLFTKVSEYLKQKPEAKHQKPEA